VLYNGVTVLTLTLAVFLAYAALFALIFLAAWVFVPGAYLQTTLKHSVGFGEYLTLTWLGTSLATVAGALGASLEHEETVRGAAYCYRQRRRHEEEDGHQDGSAGQRSQRQLGCSPHAPESPRSLSPPRGIMRKMRPVPVWGYLPHRTAESYADFRLRGARGDSRGSHE
jgi:hypothetical protein